MFGKIIGNSFLHGYIGLNGYIATTPNYFLFGFNFQIEMTDECPGAKKLKRIDASR